MTGYRQRPGDQPLPAAASGPSMHDLVCGDIRARWANGSIDGAPVAPAVEAVTGALEERKRLGLERYGQLLRAHNGRDALRDLGEEVADAVVYCRQVIEEGALSREYLANMRIMYDALIASLFRVCEVRSPAADPESARSPHELWERAGGDAGEYRRLMRQHGHLLAPGDEGYEDAPQNLPCGWSPDR